MPLYQPVTSEGTWTPGITFGGAAVGITYGTQSGFYIKIGRQVTVFGQVTLTNKGSSVGAALLTGLPFTSINNATYGFAPTLNVSAYSGFTLATGLSGEINSNATTCIINIPGATGTSGATDTNFSNTSTMYFTMTYISAV